MISQYIFEYRKFILKLLLNTGNKTSTSRAQPFIGNRSRSYQQQQQQQQQHIIIWNVITTRTISKGTRLN